MDRRRNLLVALALSALIFTMGAGAAHATGLADVHARGAHAVEHGTLPASTTGIAHVLPWAALAVLAGFAGWRLAASRARGRTLALALVLSTAVFALETGVHSVHHLGDPESAATCPASLAAQNLAWAGAPAVDAGPLAVCVSAATPALDGGRSPSPLYRPDPGRAPPA